MGVITTHALFPTILTGFLAGCSENSPANEVLKNYDPVFFSKMEFEVITEVIDLILPPTKTASASEVHTQVFLDEVFAKCLTAVQQKMIKEGLTKFNKDFVQASNKSDLLTSVDQKAYGNDENFVWFRMIKQFALIGFFTSQEGTTKASHYIPVPGDYRGEIPLDDNTLNYGLTRMLFYL